MLDYVDGGIARFSKKQTKYGHFIDTIAAYYLHAFLPICLSVGLAFQPEY